MPKTRSDAGGMEIRSLDLSEVELWLLEECVNHYITSHGYTDRMQYDHYHDLRDKVAFELREMVGKRVPYGGCS